MPVRSSNLQRAVRNALSWSSARGLPCVAPPLGNRTPSADLCIFHSQSFASARDVALAEDFVRALAQPAAGAHSPGACFGAVRFLAARIPLDVDVYTIYPVHNFTGPNTHFLSTFAAVERLADLGVAQYDHFQLMETDTFAFRAGWSEAIGALSRRRRRERDWVSGSRSMCLRPTETEHINGNALYSVDEGFVQNLRRELGKRLDTWAFDVLIGHWLLRKRPDRIRSSPHILSISTFQRNRTCCELVQSIVDDGGKESASSQLYLLHTGNIGKLRDSTVPPSMRALGLALQDLFVPRSKEPCALDSALPASLKPCHAATQPWRARLKAAGDCSLSTPASRPLIWIPQLSLGARRAARGFLRTLSRTFAIRFEAVQHASGRASDGVASSMALRLNQEVAGDEAATAAVALYLAADLSTLLSMLREREYGQLIALFAPPSSSVWRAYQARRQADVSAGRTPPKDLNHWARRVGSNPIVTALSSCSAAGTGAGGGGSTDRQEAGAGESELLEAAKTVLQERILNIPLTRNATARSLRMLEKYWGWERRRGSSSSVDAEGESNAPSEEEAEEVDEEDDEEDTDGGAEREHPSEQDAAILKQKTSLDTRLYEFATRQADEQFHSIVWEEDAGGDTCAAADAAAEAAAANKVKPIVTPLDESATFSWDGDAYRVHEVTLPPPLRAVQLMLRGKNMIGSSKFTVNIFVSHRTSQPSFAERTFRYVFDSKPPHKNAAKFVLPVDRLREACAELAKGANETTTADDPTCASRPLTLWFAFKCRSKAVSQLTIVTKRVSPHSKKQKTPQLSQQGKR